MSKLPLFRGRCNISNPQPPKRVSTVSDIIPPKRITSENQEFPSKSITPTNEIVKLDATKQKDILTKRLPPLAASKTPISEVESQWQKHIGKKVRVIKGPPGILRYFGTTKFAEGLYCGVELDGPIGTNDGSYDGVRYFICPPLHGIFAPVARVIVNERTDRLSVKPSVPQDLPKLLPNNNRLSLANKLTPPTQTSTPNHDSLGDETYFIDSDLLKFERMDFSAEDNWTQSFSPEHLDGNNENCHNATFACTSPSTMDRPQDLSTGVLNRTTILSPLLGESSKDCNLTFNITPNRLVQSPEELLDDVDLSLVDASRSIMLETKSDLDDFFSSGFFREIEAKVKAECLSELQSPVTEITPSYGLEDIGPPCFDKHDSDFASGTVSPTSSSEADHLPHTRDARIIDGKLYYSGEYQGDKLVLQQDPQVTSGMDSSGIYSDFDPNRPDSCVNSGVYSELASEPRTLEPQNECPEHENVYSDSGQPPSNRMVEQIAEDDASRVNKDDKPPQPQKDTKEALAKIPEKKKQSPKSKFKIPEKFEMPRRNVESKIKAMITSKPQESSEVKKIKSAKKGRWDAVMDKIAQNKEVEKAKPKGEVKSKVYAQISITPQPKLSKTCSPRDCLSRASNRSVNRPTSARRRNSDKKLDREQLTRHSSDSSLSRTHESSCGRDLKERRSCSPSQPLNCPSVAGSDVSSMSVYENSSLETTITEQGKLESTRRGYVYPEIIAEPNKNKEASQLGKRAQLPTKRLDSSKFRGPSSADALRMRTKPPLMKNDQGSKRKLQEIRSSLDTGRSKLKVSPKSRPVKSEVTRLEALCETRTKELQRWKLEYKNVKKSFDIISIVLQNCLTQDLDKSENHDRQLQKWTERLEKLTDLHDEQEKKVKDLECDLSKRTEVEQCLRDQLRDTEGNLRETKEMCTKIRRKAQEELKEKGIVYHDHMSKVNKKLEELEMQLQLDKDKYFEEERTLHSVISNKQRELETMQTLITKLECEIVEVKADCERYCDQYTSCKKDLCNITENLKNDTDCKVQALADRLGIAEKEIDSLRKVVDMKAANIRKLAVENEELREQLNILNLTQEKLKLQQQRTEDVKALLNRETEMKAEQTRENQKYTKMIQQKDVRIQNLMQEIDMLRYKSMERSGEYSPNESETLQTEYFSLDGTTLNTSPCRKLKRTSSLRNRSPRDVYSPPKCFDLDITSPPKSPKTPVVKGVYARENSLAYTLELPLEECVSGQEYSSYNLVNVISTKQFKQSLSSKDTSTPLRSLPDVDMASSHTSVSSQDDPSMSISSSDFINLEKEEVISALKYSTSANASTDLPMTEGAGESLSKIES